MSGQCPHTDPGVASINHPESPIVPPWRCVLPAGHDRAQGHTRVQVCSGVAQARNRAWPCVRAQGHDGDHLPPIESRFVSQPLREMSRESLIAAASMAFGAQIAAEDRRLENWRLAFAWESQVEHLAAFALGNIKSPHGNNHTAACWTKHPHCFAFALIGSGGMEQALTHTTEGQPVQAAIRPSEQGDRRAHLA